jgi:hypothetical protein
LDQAYSKYVEIADATRADGEVCATSQGEDSTAYHHAYHAQQGIECDYCHGNGSLQVEGGSEQDQDYLLSSAIEG